MLTDARRLHPAWGREVAEGLGRYADPPEWLLALDDPERVSEALVRWVPELSGSLRGCEVRRVRLRDRTWTGHYRLTLTSSDGQRVVDLLGRMVQDDDLAPGPRTEPFGAEDWSCYLPEVRLELRTQPPEAALSSLDALTDATSARPLLERAMRAASPDYADVRIESVSPRVMRYKPGRRCTVLYRVTYPPDAADRGWPDPVVAKTYHGDKGRNAHESMTALWASPLRSSNHVTVAEPLGFLAPENVLLQGPVPEERTLKQELRAALKAGTPAALSDLGAVLGRTGRGLADLHGCGVTTGVTWTFEDELADVRDRTHRLASFVSGLDTAAAPIYEALERIAAAHPADPPVPTHRSFRPAQVLIHGDDIGFIDFDSFCQAEPALDIALFCSVVRDLSLRALQSRDGRPDPGESAPPDHLRLLDDLCGAFTAGYEGAAATPVARARVDLWQALLAFDRVVLCWTKNRFERLPQSMSLLAHLYAKEDVTRLLS